MFTIAFQQLTCPLFFFFIIFAHLIIQRQSELAPNASRDRWAVKVMPSVVAKTQNFSFFVPGFFPPTTSLMLLVNPSWTMATHVWHPLPVSGCIRSEGGVGYSWGQHISSMACGGQRWLKISHLTPWSHFKARSNEEVCMRVSPFMCMSMVHVEE